jgi:hypothetical protein
MQTPKGKLGDVRKNPWGLWRSHASHKVICDQASWRFPNRRFEIESSGGNGTPTHRSLALKVQLK